MKHFYEQSLPMTPRELDEAGVWTISQEDKIYYAIKNWLVEVTAWDLKKFFGEYEITSIRRALFNLEKQGKIQHCGWVKGPKGVRVGKYIAFSGKLF